MSRARGTLQLAAGLLLTLLIVAASRVSWDASPHAAAELRLSWRYVSPTVEACRTPTDEEVVGLPQHMRPTEICEGGPIPFNLRIVLDGETLLDGPIAGNGERAVSTFERFPVLPGDHDLVVEFWPDSTETELPDGLAQRLRRTVTFPERRAILVTLGEAGLEVRTQAP